MKQLFKLPALLAWGLLLFFSSDAKAQVCDNQLLAFDGNGDYISLNTSATPVTGDATFTAEAWFNANATGNLTRLICLTGNATPSTLEIGLLGSGALFFYWQNTPGNGGTPFPIFIPTTPADLTGACHHLALTRNGATMQVYLDGTLVFSNTGGLGPLFIDEFLIGHSNYFPGQEFNGQVDEIRLWNTVRSAQQIKDFKDCSLSGTSSGLVVNWTLDQNLMPGGPNPANTQALDISGNFNHGNLIGFNLDNTNPPTPNNGNLVNNFVCNPCQPRYVLDISDQISLFPDLLTSICEGDYVHFCVSDNFIGGVSAPAGTMVMWESSDGGGPWILDPDMAAYPFSTNATCFPVKKGVITNPDCGNIGPGFIDRKYRAKILKKMGAETCTYTTSEHKLQICCKPTGGVITIVPNIPAPWCEGDNISMTVFLNPSDPWLPFGPNVTVDWCLIEGSNVTVLPYQNMLSFGGLQIIVGTQGICLQAKIYNCGCPPITVELCIPVDPQPVCGLIDVVANPPAPISPTPPSGPPYIYEICPGDYTTLEMQNPATNFKNCNPVWQYHFDFPLGDPWKDLGYTNSIQNTNTLPLYSPPGPAVWPSGAKCIYYRIECRPYSYPNSGCDPCHSNEVTICLKPAPPSGTISGPTQFCQNGPYPTLTVTPFITGNWNYCWYWNGVLESSGPSNALVVTKPGNYWVEIKDGCQATKIGPYSVEECVLLPIIKCPKDNPCACDGLPITLNGCDSKYTCANTGPLPLIYTWTASNNGPVICSGPDCCEGIHTPDPVVGTTYTLTIFDPNLGCMATSKTLYIKPCQ